MRLALVIAAIALAGCSKPAPRDLAVADAWVRLSAVPGRPAAAYFTLTGGPAPDRLIAVESAKVATIELHESRDDKGVMTMKPLATVAVAAGGEAKFAPGGKHAMLFGVDPSITPGASLPLSFRFASGVTLTAIATTVSQGADAPAGHEGH